MRFFPKASRKGRPRLRLQFTLQLILLPLAALLLCMLTGEFLLRTFWPQQEAMHWFISDPRHDYALRPNFYQNYTYDETGYVMHVRTNALGMRDNAYNLADTSFRRVLLLGDSFTFGQGVQAEETFDARLEKLLNADFGRWIVLNSGVGGWGTLQQTRYALDHLELFEPDVIVLTFCGNDPMDDALYRKGLRNNATGILPMPAKPFLRRNSHLYRFLFRKFHIALHNWNVRRKANQAGEKLTVDRQSAGIITEADWPKVEDSLRKLRDGFLAANPHGRLLIQATAPWDRHIMRGLQQICHKLGVDFVNLAPAATFLGPQDRRTPHDGHWSPRMHAISAGALHMAITRPSRTPPPSE